MLYESEPQTTRHRGQSGRMVNGKSPISLKRFRSRLAWPRFVGAGRDGLLVLAARDRDRSFGLGPRAFHVEAAVAHLDLVTA